MSETKPNLMTINMGPQHPATHGVLRLLLELDGEVVVKAVPHIGYLHRGLEKLAESMTYPQALTLSDRMDYTSGFSNNLAYCLAVEKLLDIPIPKRAQYLRVLLSELQRIAAHLLWLGTHALDLGAMTALFYTFRERETILEVMELVTGARLTPSFVRIGGLAADIPETFLPRVKAFIEEFPRHVDEYETLLTQNIIWKKRTRGIAPLSGRSASITGSRGRRSGLRASTTTSGRPIPTRATMNSISRSPWGLRATCTTDTSSGSRRCGSPRGSSSKQRSGFRTGRWRPMFPGSCRRQRRRSGRTSRP